MKKLLVSPLFLCLVNLIFACTTFFLKKDGKYFFGRNYDWITGVGVVHTNLSGLRKTSFNSQTTDSLYWVSEYGSITFNQYGKEFPTGGMNEKGLVVELMWLDETKYPAEDKRPSIGVLQWIQYQLDNSATVEELIATDKKIRIDVKESAPLHYLVADATGNVATIEFLSGKMLVHAGTDLDFPVLTNTIYKDAISQVQKINNTNNNQPSFTDNSLQRFATVCSMINHFNKNNIKESVVDYSFRILDEVSQSNFTKWSIVYDINNKRIFFRTNNFFQIKSFDFNFFNLDCSGVPMSFNMNQPYFGNVSNRFEKFSKSLNRKFLEKAIHESSSRISITTNRMETMLKYADGIRCP